MTNEQFDKLYQLLSGTCVGVWLTCCLLFLLVGMFYIHLYYDEKEKKDKKDYWNFEQKYRDKVYLSELEHRIRKLEKK